MPLNYIKFLSNDPFFPQEHEDALSALQPLPSSTLPVPQKRQAVCPATGFQPVVSESAKHDVEPATICQVLLMHGNYWKIGLQFFHKYGVARNIFLN